MLSVLARHGARATFFVVGSAARSQPKLLRRIAAAGHTVGNHTYSHADLTRLSSSAFFSELDRTREIVRRITGTTTRWLRPPYGAATATTGTLAAQRGHRLALWDVDPQDWRRPGVPTIVGNVVANTGSGDIVLLHDGGGDRAQTVAALGRILAALAARGYRFEALR